MEVHKMGNIDFDFGRCIDNLQYMGVGLIGIFMIIGIIIASTYAIGKLTAKFSKKKQ